MKVVKRNGDKSELQFDEITQKIKTLADKEPKLNIDVGLLAREVIGLIYDGITTSELDEFTASTSASMSLYNPDYQELSSRLIINNHHKNTIESFSDTMHKLNKYIDSDILDFCSKYSSTIDNLIDYERDYNISYFGFNTLYKSYLLKLDNKPIERPQHLFMRVSLGIHHQKELNDECLQKIKNTYELLSKKYFTHATPTLFNSGTKYPQMSSCYLIGTEDSVEGIYDTIKQVAMISKWAGGVGVHISNIRGSGSNISKTNGESQGVMPMLKVYNDTARYINQSSKRNGSFAMYIEPWHSDIFTFLEAKKNNGAEEIRARDLFYALWIPDLFMERVKANDKWSLMCPNQCPGLNECYGDEFKKLYEKYEIDKKYTKQINAIELWNAIINSQIESGTPYMCYKDHVNHKSNQKNIGIIKSSNLCVEVNLYSDSNETAVCNLASICLPKYVKSKELMDLNIVIYSKDDCNYCDLSKVLLDKYNLNYKETKLNDKNERLQFYLKHTDEEQEIIVNTMPQIFINDKRIGGYTELVKYLESKEEKYFDFAELGNVVETIVENLDIVIDKNYYPTKESKLSNLKHRPIGIGVQGLADTFMEMNMSFTDESSKKLNKDIFETIYYHALLKSNELSKKYGSYETFSGSPASEGILQYDMWNKTPEKISLSKWNNLKQEIINSGLRNSTLIALMPTASTAQIMGNNESFEPYTSNIYTRKVLAGEFILINKYLINYLRKNNIFSKDIIDKIIYDKGSVQNLDLPQNVKERFKTVWEISQKKLLEMSAERSPYICQSQSLNIFIEKADPKIINSVHMYGHSLGLKTGSYYIRTKSILNSQNFSMDYNKEKELKRQRVSESTQEYEPCLTCSS